jgi:ankyrin repeat protein
VWRAADGGDAQAVAAWLNEGGGVDARCAEQNGVTLLIAAAFGGQEAMVRMLLQRGASVNLRNSGGSTALMGAALLGHTTIVQALLDAKADALLQATNGKTAVMAAEHYKHTATAQLLRQHAKRQAAEQAEARAATEACAAASNPTPNLSGRRVSIAGLKGPELNGPCGVAAYFDTAKGRYEVAVEGEAEAVLLKPANMEEFLKPP